MAVNPLHVPRDEQPAGPLVDMIVFLFATGGTIWIAYGLFRAVSWVVRLFS